MTQQCRLQLPIRRLPRSLVRQLRCLFFERRAASLQCPHAQSQIGDAIRDILDVITASVNVGYKISICVRASGHGAVSHASGKTCCSGQAGTLTDQLWPQPRLAQDCASRPAQGSRVSPDPSRPEGVGNYGRQDRECKIALLALQTVSQFVPNAKKILRPFLRFSSKEPPPFGDRVHIRARLRLRR
jgi:hypothetical protein